MIKLRGDILKEHSDKLDLLWTNDQWETIINAMEEYSNQKQEAKQVSDKEIQNHLENNCKLYDGTPMFDLQTFYEGAKWMRDKLNK